MARMVRILAKFIDDILLLAGCSCVLYGLSLWNVVITWVIAGLILIGLSVLIGKAKAKHASN